MGCLKLCFYNDEAPQDSRNVKMRSKGDISPPMSQMDSRPQSFLSGNRTPMSGSFMHSPPLTRTNSFGSMNDETANHGDGSERGLQPRRSDTEQTTSTQGLPAGMNINTGAGNGAQPGTQMMPYGQMPQQMPQMSQMSQMQQMQQLQQMQAMMPGMMPYPMPYHMPYPMPYAMPHGMTHGMAPGVAPQPQQQPAGGRTILAQNGNFILV